MSELGIDVQREAAFIAAHQGGSGAVWIAIAQNQKGELERVGVFSSFEDADRWCDALVARGGDLDLALAPFLVDEPEFGLLPPEKMQ